MNRTPGASSSPLALCGIALFAVIGLFGSGPMSGLVDCDDAFWAVACGDAPAEHISNERGATQRSTTDSVEPAAPDTQPAPSHRIDNDPQCTTLDNGNLLCHT